MQFIKSDMNINFIGFRTVAYILSISLVLISIASLIIHKGPRYGVDFEGGTSIQIKFQNSVNIEDIKKGLAETGIEKSSVQRFGTDTDHEFQIRTPLSFMADSNFTDSLKDRLAKITGVAVIDVSLDMVGPQISQDLRKKALLAMFFALLLIAIYISGRFELKWMMSGLMAAAIGLPVYFITQIDKLSFMNVSAGMPFLILFALVVSIAFCWYLELKFALGAIVALVHDVTITVGIFSLMNIEFTLPIIAALLTIIGYSLNDTIIVYDRIRENTTKSTRANLETVINKSINETLSRTILTSLTTLLVVLALYLFGGGVIHNFAFAMLIGIAVGTYSSIFVASPILLAWENKNK
ncbi:MAG: protein translocase subunit SecF [Proteobacteria bacterium]|nr:protein translocase subunit SecF [Pseudomonadota bacterium]